MSKLKKRDIKKALKELMFEAVPLSTNKGRFIRNDHCHNKVTPKTRRHKGWVTSRWAENGDFKKEMEDGNDSTYFYDAWRSANDGLPNYESYGDLKNFQVGYFDDAILQDFKKNNEKLKKKAKIRRARLEKKKLRGEL